MNLVFTKCSIIKDFCFRSLSLSLSLFCFQYYQTKTKTLKPLHVSSGISDTDGATWMKRAWTGSTMKTHQCGIHLNIKDMSLYWYLVMKERKNKQ